MTTADQLAIVNRLLHAPEEAYTIAQVNIIAFHTLILHWVLFQ